MNVPPSSAKKALRLYLQRRNALFRGTTLLAGSLTNRPLDALYRALPAILDAPERAAFPSASALAPAGRLSYAPGKRSPSLPNN
jgi:hypothetical protein